MDRTVQEAFWKRWHLSKYLQWEGVGEELAKQEENKCKVPELGVLLGHCMNSKETRGSGEDRVRARIASRMSGQRWSQEQTL